ncbi:hypothetical protein HZ326_9401 [Fusarium oxysporum f. sp. albedinis]|nr:hypothetical protein HZ326_9401 [Fusarium oxysporum f. sp. albedinis]
MFTRTMFKDMLMVVQENSSSRSAFIKETSQRVQLHSFRASARSYVLRLFGPGQLGLLRENRNGSFTFTRVPRWQVDFV